MNLRIYCCKNSMSSGITGTTYQWLKFSLTQQDENPILQRWQIGPHPIANPIQ